jgi:predicted transcriptional regulator
MARDIQHSRRERQIMDVLHARGEATAAEVHAALPDRPSYSTVRALLRILEGKGHIKHRRAGLHYVYLPLESRAQASRSALRRVLATFFGGSVDQAVATLLDVSDTRLSEIDREKLLAIINKAKKEGR